MSVTKCQALRLSCIPANVRTHSQDTAFHRDEGSFTSATTSRCNMLVEGVQSASEYVVFAIESHEGLGNVGFTVDDGARGEEEGHQWGRGRAWLKSKCSNANGAVAADDSERVLEGDGYSMERPEWFVMLGEVMVEGLGTTEGFFE